MSDDPEMDCAALRFALIQRAEQSSVDARHDIAAEITAGVGADVDARLDARSDARLDAHLARCSACRRELARAERRVAIVRELPRASAPSALDGAVVAALQAGARQERVIRALAALMPFPAPEDLERRIALPRAPAVLDRLVEEDMADPAKALVSRFVRRLERLRAPDELAERLRSIPARSPGRLLTPVLVAAGLVLVVGSLVLTQVLRGGREPSAPTNGIVFVVERVDSVRDLDPVAGGIVAGFTSGWSDAQRLSREKL